ncbi:MAG: hypothetical protein RQ867_02470 [Mariprofundaceae bacterium]|nr:hypothetical protein [Mariprofundaceae bacterium]
MKLSDYFDREALLRNGDFEMLGHAACRHSGLLVYCESIQYIHMANANAHVSCIVTSESLAGYADAAKGVVIESEPRLAFYLLHRRLIESGTGVYRVQGDVGEGCSIHPTARISDRCRIGCGVTINENVVICDGVTIGDNAFIDAGAIVGSEGILYISNCGVNETIRHGGGVVIGTGVTLLSNAVVVKSIHPSQLTVVGDHSIIGIASNIGHDAVLGKNCVVSGNCVIARGARLDDEVHIGTSSVIREYVRLGEKAQVKAGSIVVEDVLPGEAVSGNFAIRHRRHLMQFAREKG